jgi:CheY-like chemotaxis protein
MEDETRTRIRKIVCIDDEESIVDLITLILKDGDFEVVGASNGPSGLELIQSEHPDVVLLDLMMPDMDGWQVYQYMKDDEYMRMIPVIIVTAKSQPIDETLARSIARVDDYITKPFSPGDLINSINKVLGDTPELTP